VATLPVRLKKLLTPKNPVKTTERIANPHAASAMRTKAVPLAVIRLIQFLVVLWCGVVATSVFGQINLTWVGPTFGDLGLASNWDPNVIPNPDDPNNTTPGAGDQIIFNGNTPGVLTNICQTPNLIGASGSTVGLYVLLTPNQTSPVTWVSTNGLGGSIRIQSITNDAGSGGLTIGDNGTGNTFDTTWGGINGQIHQLRNDSTSPCTFNSGLRIRFGGGGTHTFTFDGSGDWHVTNDMNNFSASVSLVTKNGTGTMVWYSTNNPNLQHNGNFGTSNGVFLNGGTLILKSSDSFRSANIGPRGIVDNAFLEYDDINPAAGGTLSGVISGGGSLQVNSGTLTLSGQNTYAGSNILSGGELIANGPENAGISGPLGVGSTISLIGGTLGYGPNNAFDYSSRFDNAANQKYNIDTGGQFVYYATPLASSGGLLNKIGAGVLTLTGGASYSGPTHVSSGKLVFQGPMTGTGNIAVDDGTALGVFATGTQISPSTLTLGSSAGTTLEFNNVNSTTTPVIAAGTLVSAGTQVININSGTFIVGESYPLLSWSSGSPPTVTLGTVNGASGTLSTNGNTIQFNVTSLPRVWTGASNGNWDASTAGNWTSGGIPPTTIWQNGNAAQFDDTATGTTSVTVNSLVTPSSTTVSNSSLSYSIASGGANNISGSGGLLKSGTNTLTLSGGANTYTGPTTINGILSVSQLANGGSASDIGAANSSAGNLMLDGGTLQFTGNTVSMNRLFTLGAFGGTIDNEGPGTLTLNNAGTIALADSGARGLTLTGVNANGDTLASALHDGSGASSLVKQGTGTWILTGTNAYSGGTTIANGTLQVGNGGGTGAIGSGGCVDNSALVFNRSGTVTVFGPISGNGALSQNGTGTVILANDNSYTGGTTINSGTLQLGNGGPTGSLYTFGPIVDNGTLIFNTTGSFFYEAEGVISGTGNVIVRTGAARAVAANTYIGWTEIDAGAIFQPAIGQDPFGPLTTSVVTNNGTLLFERQDSGVFGYAGDIFGTGKIMEDNNNQNAGDSTLTGTNFSTGGLVIAGGYIILGDNVNPFLGSMSPLGNIVFTNAAIDDANPRGLILNRPDNFTLSNNIIGKTVIVGNPNAGAGGFNPGALFLMGSGTVTLIGATNTYQGGTVISNGALVVGKGGVLGSVGTGPINDQTSLTFNRSGTLNVPGNFAGPGTVAMVGSGVVNLTGFHSGLTGSTAVSNGVLGVANSIGGEVDVAGGTLAVGGYQTVGTLAIGNSTVSPAVAANLNVSSGAVSMALNTALAQSNSFVQMTVTNILVTFTYDTNGSITTNTTVTSATGAINYTGGTLQLINVGPTLQVGQRFVLFSEPVTGGMPITTLGNFTVINNLAMDGSVTVQTVATPPAPKITKITSGNGGVTIAATNNFGPGGSWELLGTNDITAPLTNWPVLTNGYFDVNGKITITAPESTNLQFFIMRAP
jgi:autotransporter-associated beta strand protein